MGPALVWLLAYIACSAPRRSPAAAALEAEWVWLLAAGCLLSSLLLCHMCSLPRAALSGSCCVWYSFSSSEERPPHRDRCRPSCFFCTLPLLHDPVTCLLLMSPKGWRAAAVALGEGAERLLRQFEGVQQCPQLALAPKRTDPAARLSARAPLLVPCRLLLTCLSAESS